MPRIPRGHVAGHAYHVLNRGNGGATVRHKDVDDTAFLELLTTAKGSIPSSFWAPARCPTILILSARPLPMQPSAHSCNGGWPVISVAITDTTRVMAMCGKAGSRVFSFNGTDLLTVLRYILHNPIRAKLVDHAQE